MKRAQCTDKGIQIRCARQEEYQAVEAIMQQVQDLHACWRPDIYKSAETVLPPDVFAQAVQEQTFYVAEYNGCITGILFLLFRHVESPSQVTRNILFVDSMAVEARYRGMGIGHAFFDFLKAMKEEKGYDSIELQVNARNKAAYEMYKAYGFTEKSINMELL